MNLRALLIVPPILLGIGIFILMTRGDAPAPEATDRAALAVRVETVVPRAVAAVATGYGRVEAARVWSAIAEVDGRVVEIATPVSEGDRVAPDALLLRIDPTDYENAVRTAVANLASAEAELAELDRRLTNNEALLELERSRLQVAQQEYTRIENLVARGASTQATLDAESRALLSSQREVLALENEIALYPVQRDALLATIQVREANLVEARRDLDRTELSAPFDGRVASSDVETGLFVRRGDALVTLEAVDVAEIPVEMPVSELRPFIEIATRAGSRPVEEMDISAAAALLAEIGVEVEVRTTIPGIDAHWSGRIDRARGSIDPATGTVGFFVQVDNPYRTTPGRPPLASGIFAEVAFRSQPLDGVIAIPREALHSDVDGPPFVFVAEDGPDGVPVLGRREVTVGPAAHARVIIEDGLAEGDRVILSQISPPIIGAPLSVVEAGEN